MKKTTTKILLLLLALYSTGTSAQTYHGHYLKQIVSNTNVTFNATAYDKNGNLYAAGVFKDSASFDNGTRLASVAGTNDIIIAKFNRAGHTIWAKSAGGTSNIESALDIAVDSNNNVYVTGNAQTGATFGGTVPSDGAYTFTKGFLAKLDSAGSLLWVKGGVEAYPTTVYVDRSNHVFVGGAYSFSTGDPSSFAGVTFYDAVVGNPVPFVWKMDGNGTVLSRSEPYNKGGNTINDLDGDAQGNIVAVGSYGDHFEFDSGAIVQNPRNLTVSYSSFTMKYDNNLHIQWAKPNWSTGGDDLKAVACDSIGDIYVMGHYGDTMQIGSSQFYSPSYTNTLIAKYDPSGTLQWAKSFGNGEAGKDEYSLVYDHASHRVWASLFGTGFSLGASPLVSGLAVANINPATGSIATVIQSTTDVEAYGKGLSAWKGNIAVGGGSYYGNDPSMTLLGLTVPGTINGGATNGFVFEFTDTTLITGIEEVPTLGAEFAVYPNPATAVLNVRYHSDDNLPATAEVIDVMGREVLSQKLSGATTQIDIRLLAAGLYHIVLHNEHGKASKRIIIQ